MLSLTSPSPAAGPIRRSLGCGRVGPVRVRGRGRRGRRRAFTLVELVITLGVLGTLAAIAIPRYHSAVLRHRAELAAQRIAADLDLARRTAIARGKTVGVRFEPAKLAYESADAGFAVELQQSPYGVSAMKTRGQSDGIHDITFDAIGQVTVDGGELVVWIEVHGVERTVTYTAAARRSTIE
jgi:prepilin-type N-terminal cleavage/methylation domain-containing protein